MLNETVNERERERGGKFVLHVEMHGFVAKQNRRRSVNVLAILEVGL